MWAPYVTHIEGSERVQMGKENSVSSNTQLYQPSPQRPRAPVFSLPSDSGPPSGRDTPQSPRSRTPDPAAAPNDGSALNGPHSQPQSSDPFFMPPPPLPYSTSFPYNSHRHTMAKSQSPAPDRRKGEKIEPITPIHPTSATPPPSKSRSILNLTSSTLFGIYSPTGYDANREEPSTPWGTGAQTPSLQSGASENPLQAFTARNSSRASSQIPLEKITSESFNGSGSELKSADRRTNLVHNRSQSRSRYLLSLGRRLAILFILGVAYGGLIGHLHDTRDIAPVRIEGIKRDGWPYLFSWGVAGLFFGNAIPWLDEIWGQTIEERKLWRDPKKTEAGAERADYRRTSVIGRHPQQIPAPEESESHGLGAEWNPIVRGIGAFVGIAFAIRRLPFQSSLQVSLTLMLLNPILWYLIDRTFRGFSVSFLFGLVGSVTILFVNPSLIPSTTTPLSTAFVSTLNSYASQRTAVANATYKTEQEQFSPSIQGIFGMDLVKMGLTNEKIGVATWISSVIFCGCVCLGGLGRFLVNLERRTWR